MKKILTPAVKKLALSIALLMIASSFFYHFMEGWDWSDSFYFTVMLITTIGHAGLTPTTTLSKIFTSISAFIGIAMVLTLFGIVSSHYVKIVTERQK